MGDDPNDTTVLTPAHFLHMMPVSMVPDEDLSECKSSYLTRWKLVQSLVQQFWKKWKDEYLHQLQVRTKWHTKKPDVQIGEIVTLKDENLPPGKWKLGRVMKKYAGADGHTRVVEVKTANNTLKRAIAKIAPLPVRTEKDDALEEESEGDHEELMRDSKPKIKRIRNNVMLPTATALIVTLLAAAVPTNAETTGYDVAKAAIEAAVKVYQSDLTKQFFGTTTTPAPNIVQINEMNRALNTPEQKAYSSVLKWTIVVVIFIACFLVWSITLCCKLCRGCKGSKNSDDELREVKTSNELQERKRIECTPEDETPYESPVLQPRTIVRQIGGFVDVLKTEMDFD